MIDLSIHNFPDSVYRSTEQFMGVTPQGRMTREAPDRTEPHPTFPRRLEYAHARFCLPVD
jgi:hypothetical protein